MNQNQKNNQNLLPVRADETKKSFELSFSYLFKLLYLVLREMAGLFWQRTRPLVRYYAQEARFLMQRTNVPWLKLGIVGFLGFAVLKGSAVLVGNTAHSGTQFASIDAYTADLTDGITPDDGSLAVSNSLSPATTTEMRDADNRLYIKEFAHIAVDEMHRTGIPASISMAQAIIESRAGKGRLARTVHNHFGIKCFSTTCKRGHCRNFEDDSHKDFFRAFSAPEESWTAHSAFLQGKRYEDLHKNGKEYKKWAKGLQEKGYATADNYAETLISVIERYRLYTLDYQ